MTETRRWVPDPHWSHRRLSRTKRLWQVTYQRRVWNGLFWCWDVVRDAEGVKPFREKSAARKYCGRQRRPWGPTFIWGVRRVTVPKYG